MVRVKTCPMIATAILFHAVAAMAAPTPEQEGVSNIDCPDHQIEGKVTCHTVTVAENPERPKGRRIALQVMVLHAGAETPAPDPLFILPGGPGQSAIASANLGKFFSTFFAPVREHRDVVFVDQRGTGGSNPLMLDPAPDLLFIRPEMNIPPEWGPPARPRLKAKADLRQYTTARAVEDLETVRKALGYAHINLYGTSYGTRVEQLYLKRHGAAVRTALFKGVVPPDANVALSYGQNPQRALDKMFTLCAEDKGCKAAFPDLRAKLREVLNRLEEKPVQAEIKNPLTDAPLSLTITRGNFAFAVRSQLMNAFAVAGLPALIGEAANGDFSNWAPFIARVRLLYATELYGGMTFSVIAAEDVPRLTESAIRADASGTLIGDVLARGMAELKDFWPRGEAPPDLFEPLETEVPVLLVSGAIDPATPPAGAEAMMPGLPNGRHIVFPGGAHSAANFTGLDAILAQFIEQGSAADLDLSAIDENHPVPFRIPDKTASQ